MSRFLFLAIGGGMVKSEAEQAALSKAMEQWLNSLGDAIVDIGRPLMPNVKSISSDGTVSDGSIGPSATGYMLVEAGSLEEAAEMAKVFPGLKHGTEMSVYETFDPGNM